jgi:pyridoxine 4-dehydrogenase
VVCLLQRNGHNFSPDLINAPVRRRRLILGLARSRPSDRLLACAYDHGIRHLDTAYNYGRFQSLDQLGQLRAADRFKITSKVGFFPAADGSSFHSFDPGLLAAAIEDTVQRLQAPLDGVLLHNPEEAALSAEGTFCKRLISACRTLADAVTSGLAAKWGISTWTPRSWAWSAHDLNLQPDILMTRVGFSVNAFDAAAIGTCRSALACPGIEYRGMAPFGGSPASNLLAATDLSNFVTDKATNAQAALRASFELPEVEFIALGTSNPSHIAEAAAACTLKLDQERVVIYRELLDLKGGESPRTS